jgi:hypothetical protein
LPPLALAKITGHSKLKARCGCRTASEDYVTLIFRAAWTIQKPGFVFSYLRAAARGGGGGGSPHAADGRPEGRRV